MIGTSDRAEHHRQQHDRQPDARPARTAAARRRAAPRRRSRPRSRRSRRSACRTRLRARARVADRSNERLRSSGQYGAVVGITWMTPVSAVGFGVPGADGHDAGELGDAVADGLEVGEHVGGLRDVDRRRRAGRCSRGRTPRRSCRRRSRAVEPSACDAAVGQGEVEAGRPGSRARRARRRPRAPRRPAP